MFIYMHSCKFTAQKLFIIKSPYVNTLCKCRYIYMYLPHNSFTLLGI